MKRYDIINHLIKKHNYRSYLEIGVREGYCFRQIDCEFKVGVDPFPKNNITTHVMTSDEFFMRNTDMFDIVFIDGLHLYDQVYRDVENSAMFLNDGGCIVLHDCNPPTEDHAREDPVFSSWNGTVYKAIMRIRNEGKFSLVTVDTDWGVGILRKEETEPLRLEVSWEVFDNNRNKILNLVSKDEFLKL